MVSRLQAFLIRQRKCRKRYNETSSVKLICHTPLQCSPPKRFQGIPSSGGFPTENAAERSKIAVAYFDGNIDFAYRDVGGSSGMDIGGSGDGDSGQQSGTADGH
jgi:hypothetical protein